MANNEYLDQFMTRFPFEGLTFDDVSLMTRYADFLPDEADISTKLTERISLKIPFLSAAMDTVTESEMATSLALLGGLGIIHKNLSIEEQAKKVAKVKHHLHGLIRKPVTFRPEQTVGEVIATAKEKKYKFQGFPIVTEDNTLVGILTSTDVRFASNDSVKVSDIMTKEIITADPDLDIRDAYALMKKEKKGKLPLISNGKLAGLYSYTDVSTLLDDLQPAYTRDSKYRLRAGAAVGPQDYERVEAIAQEGVDAIVVDSAHGHSKGIIEMVKWMVKNFPDIDVIAGNVGTAEGAVALRDAGAHAVKVGIGPGSICTTRVVCGVGVPQVTAVYKAAQALEGSVPVIADGGIRHSGDVPKAIVSGANCVMLGSILAGTEESPGEKIIHQGRQYVVYRGMGSLAAMKQGKGSRERYSQSHDSAEDELVPQGIEGIVPYSGTVKKVMNQFAGGLRSSLGYCGSKTISELQNNGQFVRVSSAGLHEAHPHDVKIMREAPNYRT